ncbi:MAG: phosphatidylinositol kinase [Bacteroidetes bacterium GWE2_41_25]|nr:MAG: phosphatidylinositol kinase [Bacteroidetes bacterium GWA2_40_15]OFX90969.1 MAG: phosphatidylinositol kinase [Bacteroidetes bacterium GWE2_41_25]OFY00241.1 MAG: phosphatidylinositol kinase [Bacteroidetes bacterium GWC2_40_22]OFY59167.1 MAG: phosphatidylinositol kinase [Bacteroidetes bacterium GWF2_41_9]HBH84892.1 type II toxin-antitoxin system HipA family toxin [Bacteroidales bacterium]
MNLCPITYTPCGENRYSEAGLKILATGLKTLKDLEYTAEEQRQEAFNRATKMSIQGVQPKLSAILSIKDGKFIIVDKGGRYILKPQHQFYTQLPENEDLTMRLAKEIGLEIPKHGLLWSKDNTLTYFIKRFDRVGQNDKVPVEDFAQLAGLSRDTKYDYSMEKIVMLIDDFCTFPAIEKIKLFKMVIFNYVIGNEDSHLKNFSIITDDNQVRLSPCYDLVNSTIELKQQDEEIALPLKGKKKHLTRNILINYFGMERCKLTEKSIEKVLETISLAIPKWKALIDISFLSKEMKGKYYELLDERLIIMEIK